LSALAAFDAAIAAELPRVSHVEYDSHEICKHFASKVRERIAALEQLRVEPITQRVIGFSPETLRECERLEKEST
jgi:hypothetical protein